MVKTKGLTAGAKIWITLWVVVGLYEFMAGTIEGLYTTNDFIAFMSIIRIVMGAIILWLLIP